LRGLQLADGLLANSNYRSALVVATEQGSKFSIAETNRSTFCFIMSDAAGAAVLRKRAPGERVGIVDHLGHTQASKHSWVGIGPDAASTVMRGTRAAGATHEMLVQCGRTLLKRNGLTLADVDWLLPIQTHARVVEGMRQALEWPREKLLWFGEDGFSGSASIAACLSEQIQRGTIKKGQLMLSLAVGAGMNCAGTLYYY
jgi:3-oxoacyl-[acyl-carrier-protein] synthase-3